MEFRTYNKEVFFKPAKYLSGKPKPTEWMEILARQTAGHTSTPLTHRSELQMTTGKNQALAIEMISLCGRPEHQQKSTKPSCALPHGLSRPNRNGT
jgi:hypothetical protein